MQHTKQNSQPLPHELEILEDIDKSDLQLLSDIYSELLDNPLRGPDVNLAHAQKRAFALQVRQARQMELLTKGIHKLTLAILLLTIVAILVAIVIPLTLQP